jgi:hypothetical protein
MNRAYGHVARAPNTALQSNMLIIEKGSWDSKFSFSWATVYKASRNMKDQKWL